MIYDVAIIGAGPIGIFASFETGMLGLKTIVIDSQNSVGGQCSALYPQKPIYDIPAIPEILAEDLIKNLMKQTERYNHRFVLSETVVELHCIDHSSNTINNISGEEKDIVWELKTNRGNKFLSKTVIISSGGGSLMPKKLEIDGAEDLEGLSIMYHVKEKDIFSNKCVVIAGGGDSAVDWALAISEIAQKVFFVHRRNSFRAAPQNIAEVTKRLVENGGNIEMITPYQLHSIEKDGLILRGINTISIDTKEIKFLNADFLLAFFGLSSSKTIPKVYHFTENTKLNIREEKHILVDKKDMSTNLHGIFAIGDACWYEGKIKLILTGFSEAALAAHSSYSIVRKVPLRFEYSTSKFSNSTT